MSVVDEAFEVRAGRPRDPEKERVDAGIEEYFHVGAVAEFVVLKCYGARFLADG